MMHVSMCVGLLLISTSSHDELAVPFTQNSCCGNLNFVYSYVKCTNYTALILCVSGGSEEIFSHK